MRGGGGKAGMTSFFCLEGGWAMMTSDNRGEGGGKSGRFNDAVICEQSLNI